ncbi:hypothetical protein B0H11DRAFT_1920231, partial [Mycena galericulata]
MARKREWRRKSKELRKSNKMWAEGARKDLLKPHIEDYADALDRGWRAERDYLQKVASEYHARITAAVETLTDEERAERHARIEVLNVRIRRWLKYRARSLRRKLSSKVDVSNPFSVLLSKLAGIKVPHKARQAYQQYMHESYKTVMRRWSRRAGPPIGRLQRRCQPQESGCFLPCRNLAGTFAALPEAERVALAKRAVDEARKLKAEYDAAMKAGPSKTPEFRQRCIDAFGPFMVPLMKGLEEYTGLQGMIIMGGPMPKFNGEIGTIHLSVGRNLAAVPVPFPTWNKERFTRDVVDFMKEYLRTAYTSEQCAEAALPPPTLGDAPYSFPKDDDDDDSGSDSDSDSDSSSSDSSSESSGEEGQGGAGKGKKQKGKKKGAKSGEKRKRGKEKEKSRRR